MLQTVIDSIGIFSAICQWILFKDLNMPSVCQHIDPRRLSEDQSADEVKSASQAELKNMAKNGYQKCFDGLYKPWQKFIVAQGSYFEGGCVSAVLWAIFFKL
ncbi:hypothetical protein TNCV_3962891 [Trichonephila clavipes]|nr:hypothetical protein TNCV_3962891 [Trichonephila clavipes]